MLKQNTYRKPHGCPESEKGPFLALIEEPQLIVFNFRKLPLSCPLSESSSVPGFHSWKSKSLLIINLRFMSFIYFGNLKFIFL